MTLLSCSKVSTYQQATLINIEDFKEKQKLIGSTLQFEDGVLKPIRIQVFDTLLLTINTEEEKLIHLFNLNSKKKIGERISVGQGPNEMLQPYFVKIEDTCIQFFDMATSTLFEYELSDFIANLTPIPIRKVKFSERILGEVDLLDHTIVSSTYNPNNQFILFDLDGKKIAGFGDYPVSDILFSENEKVESYRYSFATNLKDRIAVCYNCTDLIDILDKDGSLQKRIYGPQHFISIFKEYHDGNVVSANSVKGQTRDAYFNPVSVGEDFFVLFSGKSEDEEGYSVLASQIFVFGWDGSPKQILSLDQGVFAFTVDKENKKIYGISDAPEFHLLEFSYH